MDVKPPVIRLNQPAPDRSLGTISHIISSITCLVIPMMGWLPALIIWLIKSDKVAAQDPLLASHLKGALNASVTFTIATIVHGVLAIVLIGCLTFAVHWLLYLIWSINASSALKAGQEYKYPFTIELL